MVVFLILKHYTNNLSILTVSLAYLVESSVSIFLVLIGNCIEADRSPFWCHV